MTQALFPCVPLAAEGSVDQPQDAGKSDFPHKADDRQLKIQQSGQERAILLTFRSKQERWMSAGAGQ